MKFLKNFIIVSVVSLAIQAVASTNAMSFESIKGMGEYTYEGKFKKKNYSTYQKKAKEKAINSAWTRYIARLPQARQITYQKLDSEFRMDLSPYIGNVEILDETHDKDLKSVQIIARVTIFNEAVDTKLNMASAVNRAGDDASYFSFIFLARQTTSIKSFDDKVVSIEAKSASADLNAQSIQTSEDNEVAKSSETVASTEANLTTKVTTGGSTERKADRISYDVSSPQDIDAAMGDILSTAGYEVVSYDDIVSECGGVEPDDIKFEFSQADDMSRQTRRSAINGAKDCDVTYFSVGTIDIGLKDTDPVSGNQRVYVSVRTQVWDITRRLPKKVASVGPIQYAGLGPDQIVAQRNALILAAREASKSLVDQMNAKGLY
ncbi:hypothetical protein OAQ23_00775 [Hellea sp.]|jgi:hypothetical protein|nr:hypothetical protein [Hellea sp.]MDC0421608.1 hypothetical protein [Hellea sp.]MDC1061297.1 hypothetical protein [Hellea sp.]MDC1088281.1 hypothetical protein [Hellea sp.]